MDQLKQKIFMVQQEHNELAKTINSVIRQQNLTAQISTLQQQKEIISDAYQKSAAYTNLVMIGGYAGFFATWQLTKSLITTEESIIIGLMILTSIIIFCGFEVYKMISHALFLRKLVRVIEFEINEPDRSEAWLIAFRDHNAKESKIWLFFLLPTLLTGFGAGLYLLWIFSSDLINYT